MPRMPVIRAGNHISNIVKSSLAANTHTSRFSSTQAAAKDHDVTPPNPNPKTSSDTQEKRKTMAELDEELKLKMSGIAGDGGDAGVEYEDGEVKNNMFRYI
ncbi:hypothetical protein F4678DRAFT_403549 [Xylaria arbuscula]|nr:hypothetical protein F4678DRAFT_403549 [Xylaria arbuscula]